MNGGRVDQFNATVRGLVTLTLTAGFIYGFLTGRVGSEAFIGIYGGVVAWWFASRTASTRSTDRANGIPTTPTPPTP